MSRDRWVKWAVMTALAGLVALPAAALASHGKVGLWKITVTMEGTGQQMPQISEQDRAQMRAMGVEVPNGHMVITEHCMTQAEVNSDALHAIQQPGTGCRLENKEVSGQTYAADMVCNGNMKGSGKVTVSYDSPEHYTGKVTFQGTSHGRPANLVNSFDGRWVRADCGNIHH